MRPYIRLIVVLLAGVHGVVWSQAVPPRIARDREFVEGALLDPNLERGAELYQTCAACHGEDGRGTDDGDR